MFSNVDDSGRGVCIYVHTSLSAITSSAIPQNIMDTKFVDLSNGSSKPFTIGAVYRSPNATREHSQLLNKLIDDLQFTKKNIIIVGDWNYPEINWSSKSCCVAETHPAS